MAKVIKINFYKKLIALVNNRNWPFILNKYNFSHEDELYKLVKQYADIYSKTGNSAGMAEPVSQSIPEQLELFYDSNPIIKKMFDEIDCSESVPIGE